MRRNKLFAVAVASAFAVPGVVLAADAPAAPASPHTFTSNVGFVSDYSFRGISQTMGDPAVQGGFDYSHTSGVYLGTLSKASGKQVDLSEGKVILSFRQQDLLTSNE